MDTPAVPHALKNRTINGSRTRTDLPLSSVDIRRGIRQPALVASHSKSDRDEVQRRAGDADRASALDRSAQPAERVGAMRSLLRRDTGAGKELLRQVASDPTEPDEMLTLAGRQLAMLMWADALSEFDLRDLTDIAGNIVDTARPDELWSW